MLKVILVIVILFVSLVASQTSTYAVNSIYQSGTNTACTRQILSEWAYFRVNACVSNFALFGAGSLKGSITNETIWTETSFGTTTCSGAGTQKLFPIDACVQGLESRTSSQIQIHSSLDPPGLVGAAPVLSFYGSCGALRDNPIFRRVLSPACVNSAVSGSQTYMCNSTHLFARTWSQPSCAGNYQDALISTIGCNSTSLIVAECITFPGIPSVTTSSTTTNNSTTNSGSLTSSTTSRSTTSSSNIIYAQISLVFLLMVFSILV